MPINQKYPVDDLLETCREYIKITKRRITFEYALIQDINDSIEHAHDLVNSIKGMLCHVNLIPLNPINKYTGAPANRIRVDAFRKVLEKAGIPCSIRVSRGVDIQAGCGQLAIMEDHQN